MDNINLIRKIAWSFHHSTGIEWDDLFSEACLAYCEGLKHYDPSRGKLSTFMYYYIPNHLRNYLKQYHKHYSILLSIEDIKLDYPVYYYDLFESLTPDARCIAELVLASSIKFVCLSRIDAEKRIRKVMTKRGWGWRKIKHSLQNLKSALS